MQGTVVQLQCHCDLLAYLRVQDEIHFVVLLATVDALQDIH